MNTSEIAKKLRSFISLPPESMTMAMERLADLFEEQTRLEQNGHWVVMQDYVDDDDGGVEIIAVTHTRDEAIKIAKPIMEEARHRAEDYDWYIFVSTPTRFDAGNEDEYGSYHETIFVRYCR